MIKVLNLYAGIGGNRKLWENVEVTAIENNPEIARIYQDFFPNDKVIVADAHEYLLEHFKEFDFIWTSPPCQTHSRTNTFLHNQGIIRYPDMRLWQEIVFLRHWSKVPFVVENVIPYYGQLELHIKPQLLGRHYIWCNFRIYNKRSDSNFKAPSKDNYITLQKFLGFDLTKYKKIYCDANHDYLQLLRNCVNPKIGLFLFNCAFKGSGQLQLNEVKSAIPPEDKSSGILAPIL